MITQKQHHDGGETVDSETPTKRKSVLLNEQTSPKQSRKNSRVNSNERTEKFGEFLTTSLSVGQMSKQLSSVEKSIRTTGMSSKKLEKTMLKVMDPNVHQMVLNIDEMNQNSNSDDDYVPSDRDPVQKHQQVLAGVISAPKLAMQKKMGRQSDLIRSLEQSEHKRSSAIEELKQKLVEKDQQLEQMRDSLHSVKLFDNNHAIANSTQPS